MTQEEKIIEGYLELQKDKLLGMEANALRVLCEDYMTRARKDREMVENIKQWQLNTPTTFIDRDAPPVIQHYSHTVPMHTVAKLLMDLNDDLKKEVDAYRDISPNDKITLKEDISRVCADFDKAIRPYISK